MISARNDSRAAASLLAVERALDWYANQTRPVEGPPISVAQVTALRAVMRREQPLQLGQFEVLATFAHKMYRASAAPEVPACNLGDALTALSSLGTNEDARWRWHARFRSRSCSRW